MASHTIMRITRTQTRNAASPTGSHGSSRSRGRSGSAGGEAHERRSRRSRPAPPPPDRPSRARPRRCSRLGAGSRRTRWVDLDASHELSVTANAFGNAGSHDARNVRPRPRRDRRCRDTHAIGIARPGPLAMAAAGPARPQRRSVGAGRPGRPAFPAAPQRLVLKVGDTLRVEGAPMGCQVTQREGRPVHRVPPRRVAQGDLRHLHQRPLGDRRALPVEPHGADHPHRHARRRMAGVLPGRPIRSRRRIGEAGAMPLTRWLSRPLIAACGRAVIVWLAVAMIAAAEHPLDAGGLVAVTA